MRKFYDHPSPNPERVLFLEVAVANDDALNAPPGKRRYLLGETAMCAPAWHSFWETVRCQNCRA